MNKPHQPSPETLACIAYHVYKDITQCSDKLMPPSFFSLPQPRQDDWIRGAKAVIAGETYAEHAKTSNDAELYSIGDEAYEIFEGVFTGLVEVLNQPPPELYIQELFPRVTVISKNPAPTPPAKDTNPEPEGGSLYNNP